MRLCCALLLATSLACSSGNGTGSPGGGAGGGGSTGGGALSTGGGSAGGDGGGSATGGGAAPTNSFFQLDVGVEYPSLAVGTDSVLRVAYATGFSRTVRYGECSQGCNFATGWTFGTVDNLGATGTEGYARLGIAPDGRLHLVFERDLGTSVQTAYATCTTGCLNASGWSIIDLTSIMSGTRAAYRSAPLVVDSAGRVSFITGQLTLGGDIRLTTCGSTCTTLANWQSGTVRSGGVRVAMAAQGTQLHMVLNDDATRLRYRSCTSGCDQSSNWTESGPLFAQDGVMPVALTASPQGNVYIAYNQGYTLPGESQAIRDQENKVLVWQCNNACLLPLSWAGVTVGETRDGEDGISVAELNGALVMALSQSITLKAAVCTGSCGTNPSWTSTEIDSSTAMNAAVDPYVLFACGASRPTFAAWYPDDGVVALKPTGEAVFASSSYALRTCSGGASMRQPSSLRLTYLP